MAETLGSLCDKLTIVKLKQWHTKDVDKLQSLSEQEIQLKEEIDNYLVLAMNGDIPLEKLTFSSNKIYKKEGNIIRKIEGSIGKLIYQLAEINCELWHEQDKVYDFENVPAEKKNKVVKKLALLNLERNECIDKINNNLSDILRNEQS